MFIINGITLYTTHAEAAAHAAPDDVIAMVGSSSGYAIYYRVMSPTEYKAWLAAAH